jgi:hypothetical protein
VGEQESTASCQCAGLGFTVGQKLVGRLLRRLGFSLQANGTTREGTNHPDRDAQFEYINAWINAFQTAGNSGVVGFKLSQSREGRDNRR